MDTTFKFKKQEGINKINDLKLKNLNFDYRLEVYKESKGLNQAISDFMNEIEDEPINDNTMFCIVITIKGTNVETCFDLDFAKQYNIIIP